jgi:hypothetical protein
MYQKITFFPSSNESSFTIFLDRISDFAKHNVRRIRLSLDEFLDNSTVCPSRDFSWTILCAQVTGLPSIREVEVAFSKPTITIDDFRLEPYVKPLHNIPVRKMLVFDYQENHPTDISDTVTFFERFLGNRVAVP